MRSRIERDPNRRVWLAIACLAGVCAHPVIAQHDSRDAASEDGWTVPSDSAIRAMLAERLEHNGVGVVVGVIDSSGRRVVSYGRSGASDNRPLDGETVFQIGSVTKPFTGLLLADMVVRGEAGLEDPAAAYLPPGLGMPQMGRPITLKDLATHMSGLPSMPSNFDLEANPNPYAAYTVDQLHDFLSSYKPEREPGVEQAYSNLGVALLGRLLANRIGTDYETLLTERVLNPLDMESTSITLSADQVRRLAPGHDRYLQPVDSWEMVTLPASGSLRSTVNDMLDFIAAYLGYRDGPLESAMALQLDEALGWGIRADGIVGHSGGKAGYRSAVYFDPGTGIGAVVLANARTYDEPKHIALYLVAGEPLEPAPHAPENPQRVELSPALLERYEGRYRHRSGEELEVARNGSRILVRYPGNAIFEFEATAPREFFYLGGNDDILFEVGSDGHVTGVKLYGDGKEAESGGKLYRRIAEP